jgi:hypothetical protein
VRRPVGVDQPDPLQRYVGGVEPPNSAVPPPLCPRVTSSDARSASVIVDRNAFGIPAS